MRDDQKKATHEPTTMTPSGRFPKKSRPTATFRHGKNIWFHRWICPRCSALYEMMASISKGWTAICTGESQRGQKPV
jgi:hypothetical protein